MSKLSQGTMIYFLDPADDSVVEVECATAFNPGGSPRDNLDDTCLRDTTAKSKGGLRRPGQATLGINADPEYASHVRLFQLFDGNPFIHRMRLEDRTWPKDHRRNPHRRGPRCIRPVGHANLLFRPHYSADRLHQPVRQLVIVVIR